VSRPDLVVGPDGLARCGWVGDDAEYSRYHDEEWGRPLHGDRALFEKISLEAFQAGLSWITILRRRPGFREAFEGFDPAKIATWDEPRTEILMTDERIIRNRAKIVATISNARATLEVAAQHPGGLDALIWSFTPERRAARPATLAALPAITTESTALSADLRRRGFRFVGPTTMYALMQSAGLVDDHLVGCHRAP
jgi:DNA-3-methyladenine glycosylase I